jgi:hypothetical protein
MAGEEIMKFSLKLLTILTVISATLILAAGCTDSSNNIMTNNDEAVTVSNYFPLCTGKSTHFLVINHTINDTTVYIYSIGNPASSNGIPVYPWSVTNTEYTNLSDTGYVFISGKSVYHLENPGETPEKILEAPFEVGRIWQRFVADDNIGSINYLDYEKEPPTDENNGDGNFAYFDDDKDDNLDYGYGYNYNFNTDGTSKTFPSDGANYFIISAEEDLTLNTGRTIKECLKIENSTRNSTNYYWYAKGVGLVKYVKNVDPDNFPDGEVIGEILLGTN